MRKRTHTSKIKYRISKLLTHTQNTHEKPIDTHQMNVGNETDWDTQTHLL